MKLMHLSDLHIGKRVGGFSMTEDQRYILDQILEIAESEQPDAILIAGDVYDKSVPSAEAVSIFDEFLVKLSVRKMQVFIISGNHDSPERLAFGSRLMGESGIHLAPVYDGRRNGCSRYGCAECKVGSRHELFAHRRAQRGQDFRRDRIGKGLVRCSLVSVFIRFEDWLCFIEVC